MGEGGEFLLCMICSSHRSSNINCPGWRIDDSMDDGLINNDR